MDELDESTLDSIAEVICDTDGPHHRQGWELPLFFRQAGWQGIPAYDDSPRKGWTLDRLHEHRDDTEAIWQVVRRLADPRAYQKNPGAAPRVAERLNGFLSLEGWRIVYENARPKVVEVAPTMCTPASPAPTILKADLSALVQDPEMATLLRSRLDEATTCRNYGAHLSATIMLGSVLEGVLLDVTQQRIETACRSSTAPKGSKTGKVKSINTWTLNDLIKVAYACGWIQHDAQKFAHDLRDYRNFVHPREQLKIGHPPDLDTVTVCWDVVVMTLNDLAVLNSD